MLTEIFAWMILFYLQKNIAIPNSPFTHNLIAVADVLEGAGDAEKFLQRYLLGENCNQTVTKTDRQTSRRSVECKSGGERTL